MEEMMRKGNSTRSVGLSIKTKLTNIDAQLNGLDVTSSWKLLDIRQCIVGKTKVRRGGATGGLLRERSYAPDQTVTMNAPFLIPTTLTLLLNKCVQENEEPTRKSSPLPVKLPDSTSDNEFHGGFPILEELLPQ